MFITGSPALEQIVNGVTNGTEELRNLLLYECTVIYECCVCQGLFRALPNFIAHKRLYCRENYRNSLIKFLEKTSESHTEFVDPRAPEEGPEEDDPWTEVLKTESKTEVLLGIVSGTIMKNMILSEEQRK